MTKATRVVLIVGLLLVLLAGLFPPGQVARRQTFPGEWRSTKTYTYYIDRRVFLPCDPGQVQYRALLVEWVVIAAGTGAASLLTYRRRP